MSNITHGHASKVEVKNFQKHPFHLVTVSPWPAVSSSAAFCTTSGTVMYMHGYNNGGFVASFGILMLLLVMYTWWRDIIREGTYEGHHTSLVQLGLRMGMALFIISEVMFFFGFFWAFFHSSLAPAVQIGSVWPPYGISTLSAWEIPLLNTIILLTSGAVLTAAHYALILGKRQLTINYLILTIVLAAIFTLFQVYEYINAPFTISDSVYGSTFYLATGFHGFHVFVGTVFLAVCLYRSYKSHFTTQHHIGFEAASWYWHFVDVVWIFLFIAIYWWGN
jgi:cytochrome c oxidase subunit 3